MIIQQIASAITYHVEWMVNKDIFNLKHYYKRDGAR